MELGLKASAFCGKFNVNWSFYCYRLDVPSNFPLVFELIIFQWNRCMGCVSDCCVPKDVFLTFWVGLQVLFHSGMTNSEQDFEMCLRVENVILPKFGHFGLSAATGGLAGTFGLLQVHWNYGRYIEPTAGTLSLWQVHWVSGRYVEPTPGTLSLWQVHWACDRYIESLAGMLSLLQVHWACGRYIEPVAGTLSLWQVYWACGRYIEPVAGTLSLWQVYWACGRYIGSLAGI